MSMDVGDESLESGDIIEVLYRDLPISCPMKGAVLWNQHPRVYLPIKETGTAKCPYCGIKYVLKDFQEGKVVD